MFPSIDDPHKTIIFMRSENKIREAEISISEDENINDNMDKP